MMQRWHSAGPRVGLALIGQIGGKTPIHTHYSKERISKECAFHTTRNFTFDNSRFMQVLISQPMSAVVKDFILHAQTVWSEMFKPFRATYVHIRPLSFYVTLDSVRLLAHRCCVRLQECVSQ
jgi:hypothetical protein